MASCRMVGGSVTEAIDSINTLKGKYEEAGEALITEINTAISDMEGGCKDEFQNFIDGDVSKFFKEDLINAIDGMAKLLQANYDAFVDVDTQIAQSFRE